VALHDTGSALAAEAEATLPNMLWQEVPLTIITRLFVPTVRFKILKTLSTESLLTSNAFLRNSDELKTVKQFLTTKYSI
jgi:hypothetical protein